jgi:hypothetical protein
MNQTVDDVLLKLSVKVLDDIENNRIQNENRYRQLTRDEPDADGEVRGFCLDESFEDVATMKVILEQFSVLEQVSIKLVQKKMKSHPLGGWIKSQKGVGEKQAARLVTAIGDPYWNTLFDRPRTVQELWAYCGLHVHDGQAVKRKKGQQLNWSTEAKTRAYLIAESSVKILKSTCKTDDGIKHIENCDCGELRKVYDARKAHTVERVHIAPCVRCGPSGKPAPAGSKWSDGHRHADALRVVSKELLRGLWVASKNIHEESK